MNANTPTFEEFCVGKNRTQYPPNEKFPDGYVGVMLYKHEYDKLTQANEKIKELEKDRKMLQWILAHPSSFYEIFYRTDPANFLIAIEFAINQSHEPNEK